MNKINVEIRNSFISCMDTFRYKVKMLVWVGQRHLFVVSGYWALETWSHRAECSHCHTVLFPLTHTH